MKVIALIKTNLLSLVLNELKEFETKNVYPGVFKDFYPSSVLRKWYKKHGKCSNVRSIVYLLSSAGAIERYKILSLHKEAIVKKNPLF